MTKQNCLSDYSDCLRKIYIFLVSALVLLVCGPGQGAQAQKYDLLIKGGHVIDPKNDIDRPMDLAVRDGQIARLGDDIPGDSSGKVIDARGLYVTPGLIDIHAHTYYGTEPNRSYSNGFNALPPDGFTFRAGVTTVVDAGGAGWRNFTHFKNQVIERADTRVLAFLNIVGDGMSGLPEQNLDDMNPRMTALAARRNPEIVGVKIAHYSGPGWEAYQRAVSAGKQSEIPVMVDIGGAVPLDTLFLEVLRPGDIYTHAFGGASGDEQAVVYDNGNLREGMMEARKRGLIFDVGHGGGSFSFSTAIPAFEQGLKPTTFSTDLHTGSMNDGMKNMANLLSKYLNIGMSMQEVIEASTWKPAQVIRREELGHLSKGAVADIAVFKLREGTFGFVDAREQKIEGTQKLQAELTIRAGKVVWDLNGLSVPQWKEQ
ncbi:amidohydrolase/deacetylase family metallohydrolase [Fodinibius roseus]|nr:amidohydrolase/deacetylase family metallohydrolase [Fodinibius roseus]